MGWVWWAWLIVLLHRFAKLRLWMLFSAGHTTDAAREETAVVGNRAIVLHTCQVVISMCSVLRSVYET